MGQLLCAIMVAAGLATLFIVYRQRPSPPRKEPNGTRRSPHRESAVIDARDRACDVHTRSRMAVHVVTPCLYEIVTGKSMLRSVSNVVPSPLPLAASK